MKEMNRVHHVTLFYLICSLKIVEKLNYQNLILQTAQNANNSTSGYKLLHLREFVICIKVIDRKLGVII